MSPTHPDSARLLTTSAVLLVGCVLLFRAPPMTLSGTDAACYARIAADLANRGLGTWADVQWLDGSFHEHPPLGLWLEALWFKLFGSAAAAGVWLARCYAAALAVVVWRTAREVAGPTVAAFSLIGLASLASFQKESQNPMLELPLALACAAALLACARLPTSRRAVLGFAVFATLAVWIKGVVALALLGGLAWAWWQGASWRRVAGALATFVVAVALTVTGFELLRGAQGLSPYFPAYLTDHVLVAFTTGRHTVEPSPFFHLTTLLEWHLSVLLAVPLLVWGWWKGPPTWRALAALGAGWVLAVVLPFSMAQQKSPWHLNVLLPGAAWAVGAGLSALPPRLLRWAPAVVLASALGWCGLEVAWGTTHDTARQVVVRNITTINASLDGAVVSNCSALGSWSAQHLFAFHWNARYADCESPQAWRFDGTTLSQTPPAQGTQGL